MTAAVVLAAGGAVRFGTPKQLAVFRGTPLLRRAVDAAIEAGCQPVVVVLGAQARDVGRVLEGAPVERVHNELWRAGLAGSIRAGIRHLVRHASAPEAAILIVCDQPLLTAATLRALLDRRAEASSSMAACAYGGALGVPALFAARRFPELLALEGDRGARSVLEAHPEDVASLQWPEGALDVDTVEDLAALDATNAPPADGGPGGSG